MMFDIKLILSFAAPIFVYLYSSRVPFYLVAHIDVYNCTIIFAHEYACIYSLLSIVKVMLENNTN